MKCELCDEGWKITERGAVRCECQSAKMPESVQRTPIDGISLAQATKALSAIGYFPREPMAQGVIGDALAAMCPNVEALRYVVRRACELYQNWERCGIQGLRQIVCFRYRPADGIEIYGTLAFPGGLPEDPKAPKKLLDAPPMKALPPGNVVTEDSRMDARVRLLAHAKDMNVRIKKRVPQSIPTNPNYRPIGQREVDEAVRARREEAGRFELFGPEEKAE